MLAARGHHVYAGVLDTEHDPAVGSLVEIGVRVLALDVTNDDQATATVATILETEGRIDALVNNAAFGPIGAIEDTRPSTLEHALAVNVVGPHRLVRRALPSMRRRARGVIVNVGSINGFVADPMLGAYSTSKAGLSMYTEILAYEVGHFGVRVHLVEPGGFATGIHQRAPWEPGGLDPANPYYPLQVACWGDPEAWAPEAFGDPDVVAKAIVDAIENPATPLFIPVAGDTAAERRSVFRADEATRRARLEAQLPAGMTW
jgi:NAD(P)-dependent dehydrogenase (short-subunit alcohol dehydrogenase family)